MCICLLQDGVTALLIAIRNDRTDAAITLIKADADVQVVDKVCLVLSRAWGVRDQYCLSPRSSVRTKYTVLLIPPYYYVSIALKLFFAMLLPISFIRFCCAR